MNCLFCKIAKGELPATIVYRDEAIMAFDDIHPQAPIHKILIPIKHISTLNEIKEGDDALVAKLVERATKLAKELNIAESGYRIVSNCNKGAGQSVFHIHFHLLGGRPMHWPPG